MQLCFIIHLWPCVLSDWVMTLFPTASMTDTYEQASYSVIEKNFQIKPMFFLCSSEGGGGGKKGGKKKGSSFQTVSALFRVSTKVIVSLSLFFFSLRLWNLTIPPTKPFYCNLLTLFHIKSNSSVIHERADCKSAEVSWGRSILMLEEVLGSGYSFIYSWVGRFKLFPLFLCLGEAMVDLAAFFGETQVWISTYKCVCICTW